MPFLLGRELAIPLWGAAFCLVAFSDPQRVLPFLMALFGIGTARSERSRARPDISTTGLTYVP
jgi:hypothetical protein